MEYIAASWKIPHEMGNASMHILQAIFAAGAVVAAEISSFDGWTVAIERLGLAIVLVVFFVVTGWKREQRMAKRLDWLEEENDKLSEATAKIAERINASVVESNKVISKALDTLSGRMCWACSTREQFEKLQKLAEIVSDDKLYEILNKKEAGT